MKTQRGEVSVGFVVLAGVLLGILIFGLSVHFLPGKFSDAKAALNECEKELPRNQSCKLIAIPDIHFKK